MTAEQGLLDAILDAPDDDVARLVFSDWLEEHGNAARAEFIRVQCELSSGVEDAARRESLRRRERELLLAHEREWVGPLHAVARRAAFVRGFVERVTVHAERLKEAAALFATAPIRHLILLDLKDAGVFAKVPKLRRITTLDLREGCELRYKLIGQLLNAEHLSNVAHLVLRQCHLNAIAFKELAKSVALARMRTLDLYGTWWGDDFPLTLLSRSPHVTGLTTLVLGGIEMGDEGADAFAEPECRLTGLRRLHLSYCGIADDGARALARSPHFGDLEYLDLTGNDINRTARRALQARFGDRVRL